MMPKKTPQNLLNSEIPIKQSIVFNEHPHHPLTDISFLGSRKPQSVSVRSSGTFQKSSTRIPVEETTLGKIMAVKLRRIVYAKLRNHLKKIKAHSNQRFTITLFNSINNRFLINSFEEIRKFGQERKFAQIDKTIQKNKNPHFILFLLARVLKRVNGESLRQILNFDERQSKGHIFVKTINKISKSFSKNYSLWEAWKKINIEASKSLSKYTATKQISFISNKIQQRIKVQSLQHLIRTINSLQGQNLREQKKNMAQKSIQSTKNKSQMANQLKQDLKTAKIDLQEGSIIRNKQKYDYKARITLAKKATKDAVAKLTKQIAQNVKIQSKLLKQVQILQGILQKRNQKQKGSEGKYTEVLQIYDKIEKNIQPDANGEIMARKLPKICNDPEKYLSGFDSYHLHQNQKYRQIIYEYEHSKKFSQRFITSAEESIKQQNFALREVVAVFVGRQLQNHSNRDLVASIIRDC